MKINLAGKVSAFCRELGDTALLDAARKANMEPAYRRAEESLKAGETGPPLEDDLDALDAMLQQAEGYGLYPRPTRDYTPLPGPGAGSGAQWWGCPRGWCSGRGRVRPGQQPPSCVAAGQSLVAGPLPA